MNYYEKGNKDRRTKKEMFLIDEKKRFESQAEITKRKIAD